MEFARRFLEVGQLVVGMNNITKGKDVFVEQKSEIEVYYIRQIQTQLAKAKA